jgi:hypothetical protein
MDRKPGTTIGAAPIGWPKLSEIMALLAVLAAALWVYRGAFRCFFIQDDFAWLVLSRFHSFGEFAGCFFRFNPAGTYRPLSQETFFWVGQTLFGLWPPGFHIIGIAAHLTGVLLLFFLIRRFFSTLPALTGAFIYAIHGAHVTSLYWISAFPEPFAMVFLLLAILMFLRFDRENDRRAYILGLVAMVLGVMSKESILALPLILAAYCALCARSRILWTLPYFAISGSYMVLRMFSRVRWAPYDLSFGKQTAENLAGYLSWLAGFNGFWVQSTFGMRLPESHPWIAAGFTGVVLILFLLARNKRLAAFSLLWMAFALQPVLYFSAHSYAYYLAPALAGFALLIASALPPLHNLTDGKRSLPSILIAAASLWLSYGTVRQQGAWWLQRAAARHEFIDRLLAVDRQVPVGDIVYIGGLEEREFENLENGGVFKTYNLSARKFRFLLPEFDIDLPGQLHQLAASGAISRVHCFQFAADGILDQTAAFRSHPEGFVSRQPVRFLDIPGVSLEASPAVVHRGRDSLTLRVLNLDAQAIDLLYAIDGQLMPPLLQWRLDAGRTATVFADITTPEGDYQLRAIKSSASKYASASDSKGPSLPIRLVTAATNSRIA